MISRPRLLKNVSELLRQFPVVALIGPRQCGKTTLARSVAEGGDAAFLDLEDPATAAALQSPKSALEGIEGLIVIDEFQLRPELMPVLRVLVDRQPSPSRFLLLGSASPELIRGSAQTLAGRIAYLEMSGFGLDETDPDDWRTLLVRGGFPLSYLADTDVASDRWRQMFLQTFVERDLAQLGLQLPPELARRFWTMLAHYHGQTWNGSEIGSSLGVSHTTARRWLDVMTGAMVVRQLPAWFENAGKRVIKSPKIYVRDSGLMQSLLAIRDWAGLLGHPKLGAAWEGFCIEQVIVQTGSRNAYFWGTHGGAELDLLLHINGRRHGFEFKWSDAPRSTRSMHSAVTDLKLDTLAVIYPGERPYRIPDTHFQAVPIAGLLSYIQSLSLKA